MESNLTAQLDDLQAEISSFLGWGRGTPAGDRAWTTVEQNEITALVKSCVNMVLYPTPIQGVPCDWSFLKPILTLNLPVGGNLLALPDDFGGFNGKIVLSTGSSTVNGYVPLVNEALVRMRFNEAPTSTGRPQMAAEVPIKGTTGQKGQRFQLEFFPFSDAAYTVTFPYSVVPDYPTAALPNLYGGAAHAETYKAAARAAAEMYLDNARGVEWANFQERLLASIALDRRSQPRNLGYNRDNSQGEWDWRPRVDDQYSVTFNGQQF